MRRHSLQIIKIVNGEAILTAMRCGKAAKVGRRKRRMQARCLLSSQAEASASRGAM